MGNHLLTGKFWSSSIFPKWPCGKMCLRLGCGGGELGLLLGWVSLGEGGSQVLCGGCGVPCAEVDLLRCECGEP